MKSFYRVVIISRSKKEKKGCNLAEDLSAHFYRKYL